MNQNKSECPNCGAIIENGERFCTVCGKEQKVQAVSGKPVCPNCKSELTPGEKFCTNCGQQVNNEVNNFSGAVNNTMNNANAAIQNFNQNITNKKNNKTIFIVVGAVLGFFLLIIIFSNGGGNSGPDFYKLYDDYCVSTWATVGSDGSYLSIDTNPYDWDDDGIAYYAAYVAIKNVNAALNLPSSLLKEMEKTSALDGKQTEEYPDANVSVSWKYHPDRGLEVTYKKLK